jgi:hypothetical protein
MARLKKRDDGGRFAKNLDLLVSNYNKAIDLAFAENIDDPAGFHKRCAALRAEFDTWVHAEKQTEMARIKNKALGELILAADEYDQEICIRKIG